MKSAHAWRLPALRHKATAWLLPLAIVLLWQLGSSLGVIPATLLPSPLYVLGTLQYLATNGDLWRDVRASGIRVIEGYLLAAVVAIALGVGMGLYRPFNRVVDSLMQVLKPVPPIAWIPLSILWFGIDEGAKIFIIVLGAFFPILTSTVDAIRQTDARYVELAKVLELPRRLFIFRLMIPGALPQIISGLRLGLAMAWMCVVAAELIAASSGIGFLIMDGRAMSQADLVIGGMLVLGVLGKLTDDLLRLVEKRLVRWRAHFAGL
ncbi:Putative aliphatic sulfonates transport permease protein SsuC [Paraburkholderia unamae]|uniref:ABC transporter permease n=1 Tax=Paraburkholderia unamae TaxID=219649 RepID=UPI000DC2B9B2|nr:ABC transporter permease [Paraburkholderia unamae]RAR55240.1 sulfonate transport system permease protein [Paraburkholderia unamae]CAG9268087.1 Putative aliphatic sulfonates transport permease protein SsuC [Paraburkholderia unamae]